MNTTSILLKAALAGVLLSRNVALAGSLRFANPDFEDPGLTPETQTPSLNGWTDSGTDPSRRFVAHVAGFNNGGNNHLVVEQGWSVWQDVPGAYYQPNTLYALRVAAGNRAGQTVSGNDSGVDLTTAGSVAGASADFNAFTGASPDAFGQMVLRHTTGASGGLTGTPVRIILGSYGNGRSHFDNVRLASCGTFTGGDPGEGLDLQGDFAYAVNIGTNGAPGLIGGANFTADTAPGVTIEGAPAVIDTWSSPNYGATPNDDRLEQAMRSIRHTGAVAGTIVVRLASLQPGRAHKLQLLFAEQCCDRAFDVRVNGATVVDDFRLQDFDVSGTGATPGKPLVITHTFVPTGTMAYIELDGFGVFPGPDRNPTLSAFTLERVSGPVMDFAAALPPDAGLTYGSAGISGGEMVLTPATPGQTGALVVPNFTGIMPVGAFDVAFDASAGGGSAPPAEGYSFCWGNVPAAAFGEEGPADFSGLVVSFDYYINAPVETQKEVTVKWGGVQIGTAAFDAWTNAYAPVHIRLRPGGLLDVTHGATPLFNGLALPGFAPQSAPRWGFGARTGSLTALQKLDNLRINPFPVIVTSVATSGPGSLRDALAFAESPTRPGPDQIHFDAPLNGRTIKLSSQLNPGAQTVTMDASMLSGGISIDANNGSRVFGIDNASATVLMNRLTITGGNVGAGEYGGGIRSTATLTMTDCTVTGNTSANVAGGIQNAGGTLVMDRCAVSENTAGTTGGLQNEGVAILTNCTISGNSAADNSGGIRTAAGLGLTLNHCTVSGNTSTSGSGGGLMMQSQTVKLIHTIVSGNTAPSGPDIFKGGGTLLAIGVNLIGKNDTIATEFPAGLPNAGGNFAGSTAAPLDPLLMPAGNYGGFTRTMHPRPGSPAIDPANGVLTAPVPTDQRGFTRLADGDANGTARMDIGAVEAGAPITVTNTANAGAGSLRAAVAAVTVPGQRILFAPGLSGGTINVTPEIVLDRSVFIDAGNLAPALTLSGSPTNRIFNIPMDQAIGAQTFNMTAPSGATATQSSEYNGGQFPASLALDGNTGNFTHTAAGDSFPTWTVNLNRDVQIDSVVLRNRGGGCCPERLSDITVRFLSANDTVLGESDVLNPLNVLGGPPSLTFHSFWPVAARKIQVSRSGGSTVGAQGVLSLGEVEISLAPPTDVTLQGLTLTGGSDYAAGAVVSFGRLAVNRCTFYGNSARSTTRGGAIFNGGVLILNHSTLSGNAALGSGAAIFNDGVAFVNHSTISGNSGADYGGAIYNNWVTVVNHSIATNNTPDNIVGAGALEGGENLVTGDPKLAPLGNYGGPTQTMPPRPGSPALDRIASTPALLAMTDQRGLPRVMWGKADIGAVEAGVTADCAWEVREILRSPAAPLNTMADAEALAADTSATVVAGTQMVINLADPQTNPNGSGFFPGDASFASNNRTPQGLVTGDDDDFVTVARTFIQITAEDDYTFGFSSDDGARLRIFGATFTSSTRLNATNPANPAHSGDTVTFPGITGNSDTLGVCHLTPGIYPVEFLTWERNGGAHAEVFAARGARTAVDGSFRLIGDPVPAQNFSVGTLAAPGWNVVVLRLGPGSLNEALDYVFAHWSGSAFPGVATATAASINYYDPENGGGGHGQTQTPFPGNLAGDDNNFALGARATLTVPVTADYTFCLLGDDNVRFRIKGSRGWAVSGGATPSALIDGIQTNGCCADVFGQVTLAAGTYELELVFLENTGGAYIGLWGARGRHTAFTPTVFSQLGAPGVSAPPFAITRPAGLPARPLNDDFAAALALNGATATAASCNEGATLETGEPDPFPGEILLRKSVWWTWTAPSSGTVQVDTIGSDFHTILAVHTGSAVNALTQVAADVHSGGISTSRLTFAATAGTVYRIQAGGDPFDDAGILRLRVGPPSVAPVIPAPVNDNFAAATVLSGSTAVASGNNTSATAQAGEPGHGGSGAASVWFTWTAPYSGDFVIDTFGSRFSTMLAVYRGGTLGALTLMPAHNEGGPNGANRLILFAISGVTYRIAVDGWIPATRGDYFLNITPVPTLLANNLIAAFPGYPTNTMMLRWQSEPWTTYRIEQSTNLTTWTPVTNCFASEGAQTDINITGIPAATRRLFFRVLRP